MAISTKPQVKVADEVWIATALLHREHPEQPDFSVEEIVARAAQEALARKTRPGLYVHVVQHCVANRRPNPGRYRMLFETRPGRRRLSCPGDAYHPAREGAKATPHPEEMPLGYEDLLNWYGAWCAEAAKFRPERDPLLALAGSGERMWADEHADEYVRRLREGWE